VLPELCCSVRRGRLKNRPAGWNPARQCGKPQTERTDEDPTKKTWWRLGSTACWRMAVLLAARATASSRYRAVQPQSPPENRRGLQTK
jgi:hypothetical protein